MHEILKQEITRQPGDSDGGGNRFVSAPALAPSNTPQPQQQQSVVRPTHGFEDTEFHFDSTNKISSSDTASGELAWSINLINNSSDIKNVVQMKIGAFYFPRISGPANKPDYFYSRKVYMQVLNLPSTQAIMGQNNQYHFEFEVTTINSVAVKLVPTKDTFFFQKPITSLNTFQVRFMTSYDFRKIPLPDDVVNIVSVANSNPAQFTILYGNTASIAPIGTTDGVAVYISGFITGNPQANEAIGDQLGNYVTRVIDATTFEIAGIDLTAVNATPATMVIPKNRIAFPLRFTSLQNFVTNHMFIGHE